MQLFKYLDKLLGLLYQFIVCSLWIAFTILATGLVFLEPLLKGDIVEAIEELFFTPIRVLTFTLLSLALGISYGWVVGFTNLLLTAPTRFLHFFKYQLVFGLKKEESLKSFFTSTISPESIFTQLAPEGFFGKLILKFLSLLVPMEVYLAHQSGNAYAHSGVNVYYTGLILKTLHEKYYDEVLKQGKNSIFTEMKDYYARKLAADKQLLKQMKKNPALKNTGQIESQKDSIVRTSASLRCLNEIEKNPTSSSTEFYTQASTDDAVCEIWLAIKKEGKDEASKEGLKDKMNMALYQAQRGYNLSLGNNGVDLPECPTAQLGLLVRVVADEPEKMPGSEYTAKDPSSTNLSAALKISLDAPFMSSHELIGSKLRTEYKDNPGQFRQTKKAEIKSLWHHQYRELLHPSAPNTQPVLTIEALDEIVDNGVDAWEPPELLSSGPLLSFR